MKSNRKKREEREKEKMEKEKNVPKNFSRKRLIVPPYLDPNFSLNIASFENFLISAQTRILVEKVSFRKFLQKASINPSN